MASTKIIKQVSGIKAQLVERLAIVQLDTDNGIVEKKTKNNAKTKTTASGRGDHLNGDVEEDLAGQIDQLKTVEGGDSSNKQTGTKISETQNTAEKIDERKRMLGNLVFATEEDEDDDDWDNDIVADGDFDPLPKNQSLPKDSFQGTRVFVQGLAKTSTWNDLKDHFKIAGDVAFASVSIDNKTGQSKQCGLVQFETNAMAKNAIRVMRNYPLHGETLYVRKDVQESRQGSSRGVRGSNYDRPEYKSALPTEWRRANEEVRDGSGDEWYNLTDDELKEIVDLIEKRDKQRQQKNYTMSDKLRHELKDEYGVHLDDKLKLWWTDTKHGGAPELLSKMKGEGRWGKQKPWKQIPTDEKSDGMVDSNIVMDLLLKRDQARKKKDFVAADELLAQANSCPSGGLTLRIHDESRTWRVWTVLPPPRKGETPTGYEKLSPEEMCLRIVKENELEKVDEIKQLLKKFPGREWNIMKRLKERYKSSD